MTTGARSEPTGGTGPSRAPMPPGRFIFAVVTGALGLGLRLIPVYLQFKRKAKRAAKIFKRELLANGIEKEVAKQLTEDYLSSSRIMHQIIKHRPGVRAENGHHRE